MKKGKYIDWNILKRSMDHELSEEEKNTFENWYASHESHRNYYERMISEWNCVNVTYPEFYQNTTHCSKRGKGVIYRLSVEGFYTGVWLPYCLSDSVSHGL